VLDSLAAQVVAERCVDVSASIRPHALLRRDGRPVTESAVDRALTTRAILDQEAELIAWADRRRLHDGADEPAAATIGSRALTVPKAEATAGVAGHSDVVLIVGPAGTGKTTALSPAVAQLRQSGRVVFGVAPSAAAAAVLANETGIEADTLDKLLVEHRLTRPPDHRYNLPAGATVIVDEAGMVPTQLLSELAVLADTRGWRVALVGDPQQSSSVGRGGMFGLLIDTFGAIELDRVHRFSNEWEREASLRLRRGDVEVADVYEQHGRIHGGTSNQMERAATRNWWEDRSAGRSHLLMAPTNEAVERLNQRAQRARIDAGEIDPSGPSVTAGVYRVHHGDEIVTRHNDRQLLTDRGEMVRNRATWTVEAVERDGSVRASGRHGSVHLPARYVTEHVELAYACTAMGAQGRTVTGATLLIDSPTDVRNVYVGMTGGAESNEAFVVTSGEERAVDVIARFVATDWIDRPVHSRQAELRGEPTHRPGLIDGGELRALFEERYELEHTMERAEALCRAYPGRARSAEETKEQAEQRFAGLVARLGRAEQVIEQFDRRLHRRGHEAEIAQAHGDVQSIPSQIDDAHHKVDQVSTDIGQLLVDFRAASLTLRRRPAIEHRIGEIDTRLADDLRVRTRVARIERPDEVVKVLGDRPAPGQEAHHWDRAAGRVAQHVAAFGRGPLADFRDRGAHYELGLEVQRLVAKVETPQLARQRELEGPSLGR
jgi:hypothetical protein